MRRRLKAISSGPAKDTARWSGLCTYAVFAPHIAGIFAFLSLRNGKHGSLAHLSRFFFLFIEQLCPNLKSFGAWYDACQRRLADIRLEQGERR